MDKQRLHRLAALLKEASAGAEHERLRGDLDRWALGRGFPHRLDASLANGGRPDVLRVDGSRRYLLLGDAKDKANETVQNPATGARIAGYMAEFSGLIGEGDIRGGYFAIATNGEDEARAWASRLDLLATLQGLSDAEGSPNFRVDRIATATWVAWW
jgi:hypothetical protein